ncbi:MAG: hypothetical protein GY798_19310, partial [Hyphomicrobiales bacterium]|nr:hypothetical protein [Hyphomicrobiales bacterium]
MWSVVAALVRSGPTDTLDGEHETRSRGAAQCAPARGVEGKVVKTQGDDPLRADARTVPDGDADRAEPARVETPGSPTPDQPSRPKSRKRRRRRRRRVFAAGGPRPEEASAAGDDQVADRKAAAERQSTKANSTPVRSFYGALDLGTNNCRLLVAVPREHGFRVVDAFSRIVRLGEGIGRSRRLSDAAMGRSVEALKVCAGKLAHRRVERVRLIATEACRAAENGDDFVERVERETGLRLDIVTQETEARLAVAGCASLVDPRASGVILFDIGGGSSELVWIDLTQRASGRRMSERIGGWMSLPLGV